MKWFSGKFIFLMTASIEWKQSHLFFENRNNVFIFFNFLFCTGV